MTTTIDKELQTYYENQFDLFSSQGFRDFIEQVQNMYESYNEVTVLKDEKQLFFVQGQLDILQWLLKWQDTVLAAYKNLQDND